MARTLPDGDFKSTMVTTATPHHEKKKKKKKKKKKMFELMRQGDKNIYFFSFSDMQKWEDYKRFVSFFYSYFFYYG